MSIPASPMTFTARGLSPCVSIPAEKNSYWSGWRCLPQPSAIWLRQELPVQRKRIFGLCMGRDPVLSSRSAAAGDPADRLPDEFLGNGLMDLAVSDYGPAGFLPAVEFAAGAAT